MNGNPCRICSRIGFADRNDQPVGSKDRAEFIGPFGFARQDQEKKSTFL
jgi:hypothetical protein